MSKSSGRKKKSFESSGGNLTQRFTSLKYRRSLIKKDDLSNFETNNVDDDTK